MATTPEEHFVTIMMKGYHESYDAPSVGKTSLVTRFAEDAFLPGFISTPGLTDKFKKVEVEGLTIKLHLMDPDRAAVCKNKGLRNPPNDVGVMVVYDVSE